MTDLCMNVLNMGIQIGEDADGEPIFGDPICDRPKGHPGEHRDSMTTPGSTYAWQDDPYCRYNPKHLADGVTATTMVDIPVLGEVDCCDECVALLVKMYGKAKA